MIKQLKINDKSSYDDFGVYIADRNISSPKKKSIKETVPFSNNVYDFSKINGELYWEERTLQYSFDIAEITTEEMETVKSKLLDWLLNVHDTDIYDPYIEDYHFHGSYDSDSWSEDFGAGTITVTFSVYPYKISNYDSEVVELIGNSDDGTLINSDVGNIKGLIINGASEQVTRTGKNILPDFPDQSTTTIGVNVTITNNNIKVNGVATGSGGRTQYFQTFTLKAGSYKFIRDVDTQCSPCLSKVDDTNIIAGLMSSSVVEFTLTEETLVGVGINYIIDTNYNETFRLMIVPVNVTDYTYESFGVCPSPDYSSEVKTLNGTIGVKSIGKNFLNVENTPISIFNATDIIQTSNSITFSTTSNAELSRVQLPFDYEPNTDYILSFDVEVLKNDFNNAGIVQVRGSTVVVSISLDISDINTTHHIERKFNTGDTTNISLWLYPKSSNLAGGLTLKYSNIQIEKGSSATEYETYKETSNEIVLSEPLRSLPNGVCDTYENGVITRRVGIIVLDGSEKWISNAFAYEGFYRYVMSLDTVVTDSLNSVGVSGMNTHFTQRIKQPHGGYEYLYVQATGEGGNIFIQSKTLSTLEDFKNWLSENNVTLIYELTTPTTETAEFPTIPTYDGITNILIDGNLETAFEVNYNETKNITIYNNSSHRIAPTIISDGQFTISLNGVSYAIGKGTYNDGLYLESGENEITLTGYGKITFSYIEEVF